MKETYLSYIIMQLSDEYQDSPVLDGFTHLADSTDPLHILMSLTNLITAVTLVLCTLILGNLDKNETISQLPLLITLSISLAMLVGLIILMIGSFIFNAFGFSASSWLVNQFQTVLVVAFVILFQPELRRLLIYVGQTHFFQQIFLIYQKEFLASSWC